MNVIRVCGVVIREDKILMVFHRHKGRQFWTLPGGGVEENEKAEEAAIREVLEETKLKTEVVRTLFDEGFRNDLCRCFLMKEIAKNQVAELGHDPEEKHLSKEDRALQQVGWQDIKSFANDGQVSKVIAELDWK